MDTPTEPRLAAAPATQEARQRWRLTFGRTAAVDGETPAGRDYISAWEAALIESRLPVAVTDAGRLRFALGAPLPARTAGLAELADIWLTRRLAAWQVREAIERSLPPGHELVALEDVWLGAPALAGRVAAADYLVTLGGEAPADLDAACARLMAADSLVRERAKAGGVKAYDLRPLLIAVEAADGGGGTRGPVSVRIRTRIHPELGSGRPEEVIAALGDELGATLEPVATIRERVLLTDDLGR